MSQKIASAPTTAPRMRKNCLRLRGMNRTRSRHTTAENDPGCKKVRAELTTYLDQFSKAQRQGSRDFDTKEFGQDGNMLKLIAAFLGGR